MKLKPFDRPGTFYKGNLHGHSDHSDGLLKPKAVIDYYRSFNYDFTCLSDHLWHDKKFAAQTVLDVSTLNYKDFVALPSAEIHARGKKYDRAGLWHLVANGLPINFKMASEVETVNELLDRTLKTGAFVTIAHPEWYSLTSDEAILLRKAHAVEIYNHASTISANRGSGIATADFLLNENIRILLTAADDSHFHKEDTFGGWVFVKAENLTIENILNALKKGHYYSSTGLAIYNIEVVDNEIKVECSCASHIIISGSSHSALSKSGYNITRASFDLNKLDSDFFRVTIFNEYGKYAWSNPYWLDEILQS